MQALRNLINLRAMLIEEMKELFQIELTDLKRLKVPWKFLVRLLGKEQRIKELRLSSLDED